MRRAQMDDGLRTLSTYDLWLECADIRLQLAQAELRRPEAGVSLAQMDGGLRALCTDLWLE